MKVNDLFDIIGEGTLIPTALPSATFPWLPSYSTHSRYIDDYFKRQYGSYKLSVEPGTYDDWKSIILSTLYINEANLRHLWEITQAEYNPLDNVSEHREEVHEIDAHTDTMNYGARTDKDNVGTNGKLGNTTATNTTHEVPNDSTAEKETAKVVSSSSNSELESTTTKGAQSDSTSYGKQKDKLTVDRAGNIGVTSSIDLLRQELSFWESEFKFYIELFKLIKRDWLIGSLD